MTTLQQITNEQFKEVVKNSTTWNEIITKCGLKTRTRALQRRINKLDSSLISHLPSFYGGLYSKIGKYTDNYYREIINKYDNWDDVLEHLNFTTYQCMNNVKKHLDIIGINYSHLKYPKRLSQQNKIELKDILVENSLYSSMVDLKKRLINELRWEHKCSGCDKSTYSNNWVTNISIPLEIDHINGVHDDNRIENLRFLCPNCHALTDTYRGKNMRIAIENRNKKEAPEKIVLNILNDIISDVVKKSNKIVHKCVDCNKELSRNNKRCNECNNKFKFNNQGKLVDNRPSLEQLEKDLIELNGYCAVSRKYGVSDNCIRKWIKKYKQYND